jgi:glutathione peroxidase
MKNVFDFSMKSIKGQELPLSKFKGRVALVVNVASKCGLTPQYEGLQSLYEKYKDRGFVVLGVPSNDFMGQEPGTETEIEAFCSTNYNIDFPMFAKVNVKGENMHPLYRYLTSEAPHHSEIKWNFHKFLVDGEGNVIANIDPKTTPQDIESLIEKALG